MGAPPYRQPPIWYATFIAPGTCIAVKNGTHTQRCRNKRGRDYFSSSAKEREQAKLIREDLVHCWEELEEEDRVAMADVLAKLSICPKCDERGMRECMVEQLGREWGLKGRGLRCSLLERPVAEDENGEDGRESLESRSTTPFSRPASTASTQRHSPPPSTRTASSRHHSSPPTAPSALNSSPSTLPTLISPNTLAGFFFKTPPSQSRPRTPLTTPPTSPQPPSSGRVHAISYLPSPATPSKQPKDIRPETTNSPSPFRQSNPQPREPPAATRTRELELENKLLREQLHDTQRDLNTAELKIRAVKAEANRWRKLYDRLRESVQWVFARAEEGVEDEEFALVDDSGFDEVDEDEDREPEVYWDLQIRKKRETRSLGSEVPKPSRLPRLSKTQSRSMPNLRESEVDEGDRLLPRRRRMSRMQSLGSIVEEREDEEG